MDMHNVAGLDDKDISRNSRIDVLRAGLTALVVLHHTAIVYGGDGSWYWRDIASHRPLSTMLLSFFCAVNQSYFMGLFFLIAGYFTPDAVRKKGVQRYLRDRFLRFGIPITVYGFLIGPLTIALARTAAGQDLVTTFLALMGRGRFEIGPLWFLEALLIFSLAYGIWCVVFGTQHRLLQALPRDRTLIAAALLLGLAAFGIRLWWPVGANFYALQLGYFAGYVALFLFGIMAAPGHLLDDIPGDLAKRWKTISLIALPVLPLFVLAAPLMPHLLQGDARGGFSLPAMIYALWEPFVALGIILALLRMTQLRFARPSPFLKAVSRQAFTVFIIHPPVIVGITLAMSGFAIMPSVKFLMAGACSLLVCHLFAAMILLIPGMKRVL